MKAMRERALARARKEALRTGADAVSQSRRRTALEVGQACLDAARSMRSEVRSLVLGVEYDADEMRHVLDPRRCALLDSAGEPLAGGSGSEAEGWLHADLDAWGERALALVWAKGTDRSGEFWVAERAGALEVLATSLDLEDLWS
jgi:hypothetical protein